MNLPQAPQSYDRANEALMRDVLNQEDAQNHKKGRDIEVGKDCRIIFVDTVTGARYALTSASGALALTAI